MIKDRKLSNYLTRHTGTQSKSKLVCPRCGWLMDVETAEEVEVEVCLKCGGVWRDYGELVQKERESVLLGLFSRLSRRAQTYPVLN